MIFYVGIVMILYLVFLHTYIKVSIFMYWI